MFKFKLSTFYIYIILLLVLISGCQSPGPLSHHLSHPEIKLAQDSGFKTSLIKTNNFELTSLIKDNLISHTPSSTAKKLVIYIEGDGRSWIKKHLLSKDPTPPYALGLRLAIQDPRSTNQDTVIAYLARPCQFTQHKPTPESCPAKYWSSDRFSELVIQNMSQAIDMIKINAGLAADTNTKLELIGYSGGAAVAVLLAARRNDVEIIRTVAGDLNHDMMNEYHRTTPLSNSLNPINYISKLKNTRQVHYIGSKDKVAPKYITQDFVGKINKNINKNLPDAKIITVEATHQKGWEAKWHQLILSSPIKNS